MGDVGPSETAHHVYAVNSTTKLLVHLGGTLEEIRTKVEDTAETKLMTGRMMEKEEHSMVDNDLLRQMIEE